MQIKKSELEVFYKVLRDTNSQLSLADSRIRDLFMKKLGEQVETFTSERNKIYELFCKKDEEGNPAIVDGNYTFSIKDTDKIQKELDVLLAEEISLEVPETIKAFMEVSPYKPEIGEVELIDSILSKF